MKITIDLSNIKILLEFLKSFKEDTTVGELFKLIENKDIDIKEIIENVISKENI